MAKFDMVTNASPDIIDRGDLINNQYFTIDTADLITIHEWLDHNLEINTYAMHGDEVFGFFNIIPITMECGELFDRHALKEEDLSIEHILPPESRQFAQYAYLAAVAVKDTQNYMSRQCAAALISNMCDHFLHGYDITKLKRIYANPTTFNGNHLVRKLGLEPIVSYKKSLTDNDIYKVDINAETVAGLQYLADRYRRFISKNPWKKHATI